MDCAVHVQLHGVKAKGGGLRSSLPSLSLSRSHVHAASHSARLQTPMSGFAAEAQDTEHVFNLSGACFL